MGSGDRFFRNAIRGRNKEIIEVSLTTRSVWNLKSVFIAAEAEDDAVLARVIYAFRNFDSKRGAPVQPLNNGETGNEKVDAKIYPHRFAYIAKCLARGKWRALKLLREQFSIRLRMADFTSDAYHKIYPEDRQLIVDIQARLLHPENSDELGFLIEWIGDSFPTVATELRCSTPETMEETVGRFVDAIGAIIEKINISWSSDEFIEAMQSHFVERK